LFYLFVCLLCTMAGIKQLAEDDRPREKLLKKGKTALSNAELIAILLGSGIKKKNAVEVAREILGKAGDNLNQLARLSIAELCEIQGIGEARAILITAAIELGGRKETESGRDNKKISSSKDIYEYLRIKFLDLNYEEFYMVTLNRSNKILGDFKISEGGISATVVDPKRIFKMALNNNASSIILAHNHPSGNLKPSQQDISITNKIKQGALLFDMQLIDHLIFGEKSYYSFADEGML
jgi:DNA repair protein RadC